MSNKNSVIDGLELELKIKEEELKERETTIEGLQEKVKKLRQNIFELETRIEIFQNHITPSVAESIKKYRKTIDNFEYVLKNKEKINEQLKKINLSLESKNIELANTIKEKENKLSDLSEKVELLPYICNQMIKEINERDKRIHLLTEQNAYLNQKVYEIFKIEDKDDFSQKLLKFQELMDTIEDKNNIINLLKERIDKQKNLLEELKKKQK